MINTGVPKKTGPFKRVVWKYLCTVVGPRKMRGVPSAGKRLRSRQRFPECWTQDAIQHLKLKIFLEIPVRNLITSLSVASVEVAGCWSGELLSSQAELQASNQRTNDINGIGPGKYSIEVAAPDHLPYSLLPAFSSSPAIFKGANCNHHLSMKVTQQNLTILRSSTSTSLRLITNFHHHQKLPITTSRTQITTPKMATRIACRAAFRRNVVPVTLVLTTTFALASRQQPLKLDAFSSQQSRSLHSQKNNKEEWLNPETIKQLSSGSLGGMATT